MLRDPLVIIAPPISRTMVRFFSIFLRILLALVFLAITLAAAAFLFPQQTLTVDSGETKADELVVLGGGDGRAERAAELYHQGVAPGIICTGHGDCASNVLVLQKSGVPASVIIAEPNALTTWENAQLTVPILRQMGVHRVILVTSWYHSRRALAVFQHFAPDTQFASRPTYVDYVPKQMNRVSYNNHVNIEYLKILDYWISHGVCPF